MAVAVFAGSFDPITIGHVDIIIQAINVFDKIVVSCGNNSDKNYLLTIKERVDLIKYALFTDYKLPQHRVIVDHFSNKLLMDYCCHNNYNCVIRGIRNAKDLDYEKELLQVYHDTDDAITFTYFLANYNTAYISSSLVRGLLQSKNSELLLHKYLSSSVAQYLIKNYL
jgi:pantetheine-phosphate adenylyltransferase